VRVVWYTTGRSQSVRCRICGIMKTDVESSLVVVKFCGQFPGELRPVQILDSLQEIGSLRRIWNLELSSVPIVHVNVFNVRHLGCIEVVVCKDAFLPTIPEVVER
jgi:hypothetical protein